jgi:hypothetical protein
LNVSSYLILVGRAKTGVGRSAEQGQALDVDRARLSLLPASNEASHPLKSPRQRTEQCSSLIVLPHFQPDAFFDVEQAYQSSTGVGCSTEQAVKR